MHRLASLALFLALANAQSRPEFEVASIKPNNTAKFTSIRPPVGGRIAWTNATLKQLVTVAYHMPSFQVFGLSGWMESDHYDISAKAEGEAPMSQVMLMVQSLLADRFKLAVHTESKEVPVYELTAAKSGLKLPEAKEDGCFAIGPNTPPPPPRIPGQVPPTPCGGFAMETNSRRSNMQGGKVTMTQLCNALSNALLRPVIDKTGYTGTFDVHLEYAPDNLSAADTAAPTEPAGPSIFAALQEQLGLKLESRKGRVEVLVIDHAEKPTEN